MIGGGPAGLSAAYQLARKGHAVTIFDERAELGGMMRYGIPGFRTPRAVLDAEIQRILDLGVHGAHELRASAPTSRSSRSAADFDAVFLGLGAQSGRPLPVEGARRAQRRHRHRVPARPSTTGACAMSASASWWSAAATPRSTWPPWRAASATSSTCTRPTGPSTRSPATWRTTSPRCRRARAPR
ncbi:MAG: FAD-dependent oxidoreductase [Chromatiales bacterium]|nr:FAD-dependent oxidoreductase [Chromatiales bacterium]